MLTENEWLTVLIALAELRQLEESKGQRQEWLDEINEVRRKVKAHLLKEDSDDNGKGTLR